VDESFRTSTRAGFTRARSLNTWVYSERNAVTHLPGLLPSYRVSCEQESVVSRNQEKKEKIAILSTSKASSELRIEVFLDWIFSLFS
jgi:hypothetical protein